MNTNTDVNKINESILINSKLSQHRTNHILHLILTILTAGIWSFFWLLLSATTISEQNKVRKQYKLKQKFNAPGITLLALLFVVIIAAAQIN